MPPPGGGGKRGRDTKVSLPLLTPRPFLRTRLPSVARLKARGPQGRLVLQGPTLDGSEAFRSRTLPPCTVWPRTDSATDNAREIQGLTASQNLPDARNRAPVTHVSLHISDVSAQRKVRGVKRGQETIRCPVPFCPSPWARRFPPVNTGAPRRRRRPLSTPSEGVKPPPAAHRCIGGRFTVCRRYKRKGRCPVGDNLQNVHI